VAFEREFIDFSVSNFCRKFSREKHDTAVHLNTRGVVYMTEGSFNGGGALRCGALRRFCRNMPQYTIIIIIYFYYLRQGGYVIVVVCLSVCLSVNNFAQKRPDGLV